MTRKSKQLPLFLTPEISHLAPARAIQSSHVLADVYQNDSTPAGISRAGDLFELDALLDPVDWLMIRLEGGIEALTPDEIQGYVDDRRRCREDEARQAVREAEEAARKAEEGRRQAMIDADLQAKWDDYDAFVEDALSDIYAAK